MKHLCLLKIIAVLLIFFSVFGFCSADTFDSVIEQCMKSENYTTTAMIQCSYTWGDYYKTLGEKQTIKLKNKLSPAEYSKVLHNQKLFENYAQFLNKSTVKILYSTTGSIYRTIASGVYLDTYEYNTRILDIIYSKKIHNEDFLSGPPTQNPKEKINKLLVILETNLTPSDKNISQNKYCSFLYNKNDNYYMDVLKSQHAWQLYFDDTKKNIIPMFQSKPEIQSYIINMLYETRITALNSINSPFNDF